MTAYGFSESVDVSLDCAPAWFDEELEPQPLPRTVFTRLVFPHWVLSDIEAEKGETRFTVHRIASMGDASLAGFQFQSHVLKPFGKHLLTLLNNGQVLVKHHQVVGVSNHLRRIETLMKLGGKSLHEEFFHAVQCNVG